MKTYLITGGAGFIGSNFVRYILNQPDCQVINYDKLTYAGNLHSLSDLASNPNHSFVHADINDKQVLQQVFAQYSPQIIINFAAESHVDRSIDGPKDFMETNIMGTFALLEVSREYWGNLSGDNQQSFRFLHVSTDEVYGSLGPEGYFTENTPYAPNSPYSASKASSDHIVRAYYHTYGLPVITTNCSNNYGQYQFPEKLIPLMIINALAGKVLPVYGDGGNIRDWLYVLDHCEAIKTALERGLPGQTYNIGGNNEKTNLEVVSAICDLLDDLHPRKDGQSYHEKITFVQDRPGHDQRYAIDASKIKRQLGWEPKETFETGLRKTVQWYLDNSKWWTTILDGSYRGQRLGLGR